MVEITELVKLLFVSPLIGKPPEGTVYHLYWPALPPDAVNVMAAGSHEELPIAVGAEGMGWMVAVTEVLVDSQTPLSMLT